MKILLLGGTYFVGQHVARELAQQGHSVTLLNRGTRKAELPTLYADRNDPVALRSALQGHSFDVVIDTSCYDATQAVIAEGALTGRYARWVFVSAAAVYADRAPRPLLERNPPVGSVRFGSYGEKKAGAERVLTELCGHRLDIVRPGYVYGPGNNLARETFIWSRLLAGELIYLPADAGSPVSFIHVHDLARAVVALLASPADRARTYNLAHPESVSLLEWVQCLARVAAVTAELRYVPTDKLGFDARQFFPFRDIDVRLDVSRMATEVGFSASYDLEAGLRDTYASYERGELEHMLRRSSVEIELSAVLAHLRESASTSPPPTLAF